MALKGKRRDAYFDAIQRFRDCQSRGGDCDESALKLFWDAVSAQDISPDEVVKNSGLNRDEFDRVLSQFDDVLNKFYREERDFHLEEPPKLSEVVRRPVYEVLETL